MLNVSVPEPRLQRPGVVAGIGERMVRKYVNGFRAELCPKEWFVDRIHAPGETMEVDFGEPPL